jgi:hypothetical protein
MRLRSAGSKPIQPAISARLRPHPRQSFEDGSMVQTRVHGVSTEGMAQHG